MTAPPAGSESGRTGRLLGEVRLIRDDPDFLTRLRSWLDEPLHGCTRGVLHEAAIVLGELLANAYRHAEPPYLVRLATSSWGHVVRMEVADATAPPTDQWEFGKGLFVVRGLCPRWGIEDNESGKTVWAELPVLVPPTARAPDRSM